MTKLEKRKSKLSFETAESYRGRNLMIEVGLDGRTLWIRLKGTRTRYPMTWSNVFNRAVLLAAEEKRKAKKKGRTL